MAKRKNKITPSNDTKVAAVVLGLFVAAVALFFFVSKGKQEHKIIHQQKSRIVSEPKEEAYTPENTKPVETLPVPQEVIEEPIKNITGSSKKIAFIIDDWGQSTASCKYLKEIPEPIAVAILPGLRHTKDVANCAKLYHKLTMLHLPLEALHNNDIYPPDYIIKTTMKPDLVAKIADDDMNQLPSIEGVNNHMGSKATGDRALMRIIFKRIKKRGLFFVDSMTAPNSICSPLAGEMGLPIGKRDVFLDNVITREAITKQFMVLAQRARHKGYAVAIGHAFNRLTMQILKEEIPMLEKQGFEIVSIKELLRNK